VKLGLSVGSGLLFATGLFVGVVLRNVLLGVLLFALGAIFFAVRGYLNTGDKVVAGALIFVALVAIGIETVIYLLGPYQQRCLSIATGLYLPTYQQLHCCTVQCLSCGVSDPRSRLPEVGCSLNDLVAGEDNQIECLLSFCTFLGPVLDPYGRGG
jgi:hypothetical protein